MAAFSVVGEAVFQTASESSLVYLEMKRRRKVSDKAHVSGFLFTAGSAQASSSESNHSVQ